LCAAKLQARGRRCDATSQVGRAREAPCTSCGYDCRAVMKNIMTFAESALGRLYRPGNPCGENAASSMSSSRLIETAAVEFARSAIGGLA
jgi:hypothetical protein